VFIDGEKHVTLRGDGVAEDFLSLIEEYVEQHYPSRFPHEPS
jgi:(E)-4-hydroxy-3-methylbut-2-enyl-diphosphate synthase